jgi:hypothetical protein
MKTVAPECGQSNWADASGQEIKSAKQIREEKKCYWPTKNKSALLASNLKWGWRGVGGVCVCKKKKRGGNAYKKVGK